MYTHCPLNMDFAILQKNEMYSLGILPIYLPWCLSPPDKHTLKPSVSSPIDIKRSRMSWMTLSNFVQWMDTLDYKHVIKGYLKKKSKARGV